MSFFETSGNAICTIANSDKPIITSDVWYEEYPAYYGSWSLSHLVPQTQRDNINQCEYIYISHGHPDHLNLPSLRHHKHQKILVAQHYGSRISVDLRRAGFNVLSLPDSKWIDVAKDIRIMLFCNELQDSALVTEVTVGPEKYLIVNLNDSFARGFRYELAQICRQYKYSFYLQLHGYGDADMINLYDEQGRFVRPFAATQPPIGYDAFNACKRLNCNVVIPFSGFHQYHRRDSSWANEFLTPVNAFNNGWPNDSRIRLLSPFVKVQLTGSGFSPQQYDSESSLKVPLSIHSEAEYGDNWDEDPNELDCEQIYDYFSSIESLERHFKAVEVVIGSRKIIVSLKGRRKRLRFFSPRRSFMNALRTNTFDNLLIGNFMRTQCFGYKPSIYFPDFGITASKQHDNGRCSTLAEVANYNKYYSSKRLMADSLLLSFRNKYNAVSNLFPGSLRASVKRSISKFIC